MDEEYDLYGTIQGCKPSFDKMARKLRDMLHKHLLKYSNDVRAAEYVVLDFQEFMMIECCSIYLETVAALSNRPKLMDKEILINMSKDAIHYMRRLSKEVIEAHNRGEYE